MRRTFQDLARRAQIHDVVTRAISGHSTERMQRHYSTAQREEMRSAVARIVSLFSPEGDGKNEPPKPEGPPPAE
jgi:hypothetical protein